MGFDKSHMKMSINYNCQDEECDRMGKKKINEVTIGRKY